MFINKSRPHQSFLENLVRPRGSVLEALHHGVKPIFQCHHERRTPRFARCGGCSGPHLLYRGGYEQLRDLAQWRVTNGGATRHGN